MIRFSLVLFMGLLLTLIACGGENPPAEDAEPTAKVAATSEAQSANLEATATAEPTSTATAEPTVSVEPTATADPPTEEPEEVEIGMEEVEQEVRSTLEGGEASAEDNEDQAGAEDGELGESEADIRDVVTDLDKGFALIEKAEAAAENYESAKFVQEQTVSAGDFEQFQTQNCQVQTVPERSYCEITTAVSTGGEGVQEMTSVAYADESGAWVKVEDRVWEEIPADVLEEMGINESSIGGFRLSQVLLGTQLLGETALDGVRVSEVEIFFDVPAFFTEIMTDDVSQLLLRDSTTSTGSGKMFIDVETNRLVRQEIQLTLLIEGEKLVMKIETEFFDINEPLDIPELDLPSDE